MTGISVRTVPPYTGNRKEGGPPKVIFIAHVWGGEEERVEVRPHVRDFYDYLQIDQIFGLNANFPVTVLLT